MKSFLQNSLIFLALCLCALAAFQWHREAGLRRDVQSLNNTIHDKLEAIQNLQGRLKLTEEEVKRLDGLKNQLTEIVKSNRVEITQLQKDLEKVQAENGKNQKQIEVYKTALQQANDAIKKQNEDVLKQNEELKKLADERNEAVVKYNKVVQEFNDLAQKWNTLQEKATNAPPTNAPPKK